MSKYTDLGVSYSAWRQRNLQYHEEAIHVAAAFFRGLTAHLGLPADAYGDPPARALRFLPPPGQEVGPKTVVLVAGSLYETERGGWAFRILIVLEGSDPGPPYALAFGFEYFKLKLADVAYTFRAADREFSFADVSPETFGPVYDWLVEAFHKRFEEPITPADGPGAAVN
jgi:hypothetical protein